MVNEAHKKAHIVERRCWRIDPEQLGIVYSVVENDRGLAPSVRIEIVCYKNWPQK